MTDPLFHILVVDDDDRIRTLLERFLARESYRISTAKNVADARAQIVRIAFDLIIADIMMPDDSGLELLKWIRQRGQIPVLMLSALAQPNDRISGLALGADDYLPKPFEPEELLLRIGAILRRVQQNPQPNDKKRLRIGPTIFDPNARKLIHDDHEQIVSENEARLIAALAAAYGDAVSRERLAELSGTLERSVDVAITRLRRKIEPDPDNPQFLQAVRGIGYRLMVEHLP